MSYSVEPGDADQTIELVSILKDGSDATSFVTCSIDTLQKKITLTSLGQMLCAVKLSFIHPLTKERMTFEVDEDDEFKRVLNYIRENKL